MPQLPNNVDLENTPPTGGVFLCSNIPQPAFGENRLIGYK